MEIAAKKRNGIGRRVPAGYREQRIRRRVTAGSVITESGTNASLDSRASEGTVFIPDFPEPVTIVGSGIKYGWE